MIGPDRPVVRLREKVRADIAEPNLSVAAGELAMVEVEVTNLDTVIRSFHVSVLGLDPECVEVLPPVVDLFPEERQTVTVLVALPPAHAAGPRTLAVEVLEPRVDAPAPAVAEFVIDVAPAPGLELSSEPATLEMGGAGTFIVHAVNTGNTTLELDLVAQDPERLVEVTFEPERPVIAPGDRAVVGGTITGPRPWAGMPVVRVIEVTGTAGEQSAVATFAIVQRPRISRRLIAFLGLLLVVTLFAYLIQRSFARVAELSAENEALVKQSLGFDDDAAARVAPGGVSGSILSSTGAGIDGAAVLLYEQDNPVRPLQSTVSGEAGSYRFPAVADGAYLVKTDAAGFGEIWYPDALTFEDAEVVELADGAPVTELDIVLTGRPGLVAGTVLGADVEEALVEVRLPAESVTGSDLPAVASVVQSVVVDATGRFVLPDLATPATYELVVSKVGFATEVRTLSLKPGEQRDRLEVLLRRGSGRIAGSVVDTAGVPIGGVVIAATDGSSESTTRSLSGDADAGTFELRDLITPGTYTVSFRAPGFFTETATLTLDDQQQRDDVVIVMARDQGSLAGTVRSTDGRPLGGINVSVVGGQISRATETFSVDAVGTWLVDALPAPGTYTVTFSGAGYRTTAMSVDLGPGAEAVRGGVDAVLTAATARIRGTVTDTSGTPIGGVQITLERSGAERHTVSSDAPPGAYVFDGVTPGAYTLTYRRGGSTPQTLLVDVAAGEQLDLAPVVLEQQARIIGVVTNDGVGAADVGVVVYRLEEYPAGVVATTTTGPGGTFEIVGLAAPDSYVVEFQVPAGGQAATSRMVFLQPDQVIELEVEL